MSSGLDCPGIQYYVLYTVSVVALNYTIFSFVVLLDLFRVVSCDVIPGSITMNKNTRISLVWLNAVGARIFCLENVKCTLNLAVKFGWMELGRKGLII